MHRCARSARDKFNTLKHVACLPQVTTAQIVTIIQTACILWVADATCSYIVGLASIYQIARPFKRVVLFVQICTSKASKMECHIVPTLIAMGLGRLPE